MRSSPSRRRRAALAAAVAVSAALTALAPLAAQPTPTFSAKVEGVRVDVLVSDNGRPVPGLGADDFDVRDDGVRQQIDLVNLADVPVSVVLTLDYSGSVSGAKLSALQGAGRALLDGLAPGDTASLITFSHAVIQRMPMTADLAQVRAALEARSAGGATSLIDAALAAMLIGDTDAGRTLVVLFSDGIDTASVSRASLVLGSARRTNGVVYGVAASGSDPGFLRDLSAATGGRVVTLGVTGDPAAAFVEILQEFRRRYVITFTPSGATKGGWHPLDVRVNRKGVKVQARAGYFAAPPP